ncbi:hypothetical protein A2Z33_02270 [Candidatus Gottesmanbacteria bacterium RBG_16_52_11]|uniref:N-acetyltransferase domain-containing protein n=1 Tax=Candidatus Gottesmanbacteria bacterium RBG_16_52_11 TaxID=1798374 RepID=A0A1F5YQW9_9BACT|nr:MAG: hypothetical protein A2Z33_02270 [Candidatus Gottesmanbacteria bacterium RBG_16_52_11]
MTGPDGNPGERSAAWRQAEKDRFRDNLLYFLWQLSRLMDDRIPELEINEEYDPEIPGSFFVSATAKSELLQSLHMKWVPGTRTVDAWFMWLDPSVRGQGVGSQALTDLEDMAVHMEADRIVLSAISNESLHRHLIEKAGYVQDPRQSDEVFKILTAYSAGTHRMNPYH